MRFAMYAFGLCVFGLLSNSAQPAPAAKWTPVPFASNTINPMFDLTRIQSALKQFGLDGWLIYDFRGSNLLARRIVDLRDDQMGSRRWFYFVPATGQPRKLVHRVGRSRAGPLAGTTSKRQTVWPSFASSA